MDVLLVGTGNMGRAYASALRTLGVDFFTIGRSRQSALAFEHATGKHAFFGGTEQWPIWMGLPKTAIVAVPGLDLRKTTSELAARGVSRILLEKPGARDPQELRDLQKSLPDGCRVALALNRRFLPSVQKLLECISEEGKVRRIDFEFGEPIERIATLPHPPEILSRWVFHNACHVADLAFAVGGAPRDFEAVVCGSTPWHPDGSAFSGRGLTEKSIPFSFRADWETAGRWKLEVHTEKHTYLLAPLEKLTRLEDGRDLTPIASNLESGLKPGILAQARAFLAKEDFHFSWLDRSGELPAFARWAEGIYMRAIAPSSIATTSPSRFTRKRDTSPWL